MHTNIARKQGLSFEDTNTKAAYSLSNAPSTNLEPPKQEASKFVRVMRTVFQKGYNFPLFVIFGGAMLGFTLARFSYLNIGGNAPSIYKSGSAPGEWYYARGSHYRFGMTLHLITVTPAGFLAVFQFIPVIRHKALLFHPLSGYIILLLSLLGTSAP